MVLNYDSSLMTGNFLFFFLKEKEGIRDVAVTGVQTCALPILGDEECANFAWPLFAEAFRRTNDPRHALLWAGKQYADLGFFADAVEVLAELCSRFDDAGARRLLAQLRWWRDNA